MIKNKERSFPKRNGWAVKRMICAGLALLLLAVFFCSTGCGIITLVPIETPVPKPAETPEPTPYEKPVKYKAVFDPDEVFPDDLEREASERIDGIILRAVSIMNSMDEELAGELDLGDYSKKTLAKDGLKNELDIEFYEKIEKAAEEFGSLELIKEDYGIDLFYSVTNAVDALRIDRQELFLYCDMRGTTDYHGTSYRLAYYMPNEWLNHETEDKEAVKEKVELYYRILDRIVDAMPEGLTNYEKCCYFIFVVTCSTKYDILESTLFDMYQAYNVLVLGNAVCRGYADALYELMRKEGIKCEVITGEAPTGGRHAWNAVETGGKKLYIDVTWYDNDFETDDYRDGKDWYLFMTEEELLEYGYVPD